MKELSFAFVLTGTLLASGGSFVERPAGDERDEGLAPSAAAPLAADDGSLFVPVVLSSSGAAGSFYTSEMTLTNRGTSAASITYTYTAASGGGSGTGGDTIAAGQQRIVADAIAYLRSRGVPIPDSGNRVGTLRVSF